MPPLIAAADRIDYWIRRRIVPCDALLPRNAHPGSERYVGLTAIGKSLRDQLDTLAVPVPSHLAALVKRLDEDELSPQKDFDCATTKFGRL